MSKIHASCFECVKGGGGKEGGLAEEWGWARRKLSMELWPILKRSRFVSSPPSPLGGGLSFLIYKEREENESSLNKNSKGHFYVQASSQ